MQRARDAPGVEDLAVVGEVKTMVVNRTQAGNEARSILEEGVPLAVVEQCTGFEVFTFDGDGHRVVERVEGEVSCVAGGWKGRCCYKWTGGIGYAPGEELVE